MRIPSDEVIFSHVQKAVADTLRESPDRVEPDSHLRDDLGMTSLDFVDIGFRLETEFGVEFYHGSAVERLEELLAPEKLEEDGLLTPFGAAVLQLRLPEIDSARLREGEPAAGIEAMFTPRTWLRVVKELLNARPEECPRCQSKDLEVLKPSILRCNGCSREVTCPDGEECLESWANSVPARLEEMQQSGSG